MLFPRKKHCLTAVVEELDQLGSLALGEAAHGL
jgi:hypothetical protein